MNVYGNHNAPIFQPDERLDSGDEAQVEVETNPMEESFVEAPLDDDLDDVVDGMELLDFEDGVQPAAPTRIRSHICIDALNQVEDVLNFEFNPGNSPHHRSLMETEDGSEGSSCMQHSWTAYRQTSTFSAKSEGIVKDR